VIGLGSSHDLMRGETVIAIGNPFGYQHTVTVGIVSALHRNVPVNGTQEYYDLIQTNADINPGNSGGPLINIDGEMIGINVAVRVGAQGIGFAIPIDAALEVIADLVASSQRQQVSLGMAFRGVRDSEGSYLEVASVSRYHLGRPTAGRRQSTHPIATRLGVAAAKSAAGRSLESGN
jgi:serine protease Do